MRHIVLIGSGKSTHHLIQFLLNKSQAENLFLTIASLNIDGIKKIVAKQKQVAILQLKNDNNKTINQLIQKADIVISMLPAHLHYQVAKLCLHENKNLITASYISPEMKALNTEVKKKGLLFLNEMGLDPGLDHMSSMKIIHEIKQHKGTITSYQSYCGGLIAPESDTNPWNYKFTWNPRNVILAGQGPAALYLKNEKPKRLPYNRLFKKPIQFKINNRNYEGYPNRNSNTYIETYGLKHIKSMIRGTLRQKDFCTSWDILIQLGLTDDSYSLTNSQRLTPLKYISLFLPEITNTTTFDRIELVIDRTLSEDERIKLSFLDFENDTDLIPIQNATPAQVLEFILLKKWSLEKHDKDMIVMNHIIEYVDSNQTKHQINSQLEVIGENATYTAMSKTVGLPLGIATLLILNKKIQLTGVHSPIHQEIYQPVLKTLNDYGITFKESTQLI